MNAGGEEYALSCVDRKSSFSESSGESEGGSSSCLEVMVAADEVYHQDILENMETFPSSPLPPPHRYKRSNMNAEIESHIDPQQVRKIAEYKVYERKKAAEYENENCQRSSPKQTVEDWIPIFNVMFRQDP
jgi:hypothetical protein